MVGVKSLSCRQPMYSVRVSPSKTSFLSSGNDRLLIDAEQSKTTIMAELTFSRKVIFDFPSSARSATASASLAVFKVIERPSFGDQTLMLATETCFEPPFSSPPPIVS